MQRLLSLLLASLASAATLAADQYTIDPNHTLPVFEVSHLGFSTQRGRFDHSSGRISLDLAKQTGTVELTIDANSINMGQTKWNDHLKSADFFDTARFPAITFKSDKLQFADGKPVVAEGTLTLLGVSKPVKLKIKRFTCGINPIAMKSLCAADIETTLKRSDYGMTKYLPGIGDDVRVLAPVEAFKD